MFVVLVVLIMLKLSYSYEVYVWMMKPMMQLIIGLLCFLSFTKLYEHQSVTIKTIQPYLFLSIGGLFAYGTQQIGNLVALFAMMLPILAFTLLKKEDLVNILKSIEFVFFVLVSLSFSLYLLDMMEMLPSLKLTVYEQYDLYNYFLYLNVVRYRGAFCGFTLEAGYISLLLVALLVINEYNFKLKRNWLYLAALMCTLSLGGYLLGIISFIMQKLLKQKSFIMSIFTLVLIFFVLAVSVVYIFSYKNGNNIIAEEVLSRLMFDEELGIVGNNRENIVAKDIYDQFFYSNAVWFGIGNEAFRRAIDVPDFDACSWRGFIIAYGAVYTIFFFIGSLYILSKTVLKKTLPFFVVYWLDFFQHGYLYNETLYLMALIMLINWKSAQYLGLTEEKGITIANKFRKE